MLQPPADELAEESTLADAPWVDDGGPLLVLPEPTGPLGVGTAELLAVDGSRPTATGEARTLLVRLWYPAVTSDAAPAPYFLDAERAARAGEGMYMQLPEDLLEGTQAFARERVAPAAPEPRATVLLSPGWHAPVELYGALAAELASFGYVVLGVQHPGGPGALDREGGAPSVEPWERVPDARTNAAWASDLEFLASWLADPDAAAAASLDADAHDNVHATLSRLDLGRVAALGHCFGGSAALAADAASTRIGAAIALESAIRGAPAELARGARALLLSSPADAERDPALDEFLIAADGRSQAFEIEGTLYADYADTRWLFSELLERSPDLGEEGYGLGPIGADRAHVVISTQVRQFLASAWSPSGAPAPNFRQFPEVRPHEPSGARQPPPNHAVE
jgi:predicted dienelactone hydrolase